MQNEISFCQWIHTCKIFDNSQKVVLQVKLRLLQNKYKHETYGNEELETRTKTQTKLIL